MTIFRARTGLGLMGALALAPICLAAMPAAAQEAVRLKLPPQPLAEAIRQVGRKTRTEIVFSPSIVDSRRVPALDGSFTTQEALDRLLAGTGLVARRTAQGAFVIERPQTSAGPSGGEALMPVAADDTDIVVTATKRPEVARKISGSISVQTGEQLEKLGAQGLGDYLQRMPGVIFNAARPGDGAIAIRGIASTTGKDQGQATTGIFINDVPLTDPSISIGTPDIDTFDVANVSVLRGAQGTLFGSASLGGAVNYQASRPDLGRTSARVQGTLSGTQHGGTGGAGKAMINAPIIDDVLGVRGVFVYRRDAGYIDNIGTGKSDSNTTVTKGGRLLVSWKPGPRTTINYMYLEQKQETEDVGFQQPLTAGTLRKSTLFDDRATFSTLIHNLRLDQDLDFATLTATATYHRKKSFQQDDYTSTFSADLFGLAPVTSEARGRNRGQTYEIRIASAPGGAFDYVVGAMYDSTKTALNQRVTATGLQAVVDDLFGPGSGAVIAPGDLFIGGEVIGKADEKALFGEATYHLDDRLKVTLGGRLFDQQLKLHSTLTGLAATLGGNPASGLGGGQKSSGFNPKGSITWTPGSDLMIYALASKGFRFGGPNIIPGLPGTNVPAQYRSDSLWNYELGARMDLFDRKLLLDVTAFYIDWSDIQLRLTSGQLNYADNAGSARSYGVEASATLRPIDGVSLTSSLTYLNAKLSDSFDPDPSAPGPVVPRGSTLPGASKWQLSNVLGYEHRDAASTWSFLLSHRYVSRAPGALVAGGVLSGAELGGYHLFNLRAGVSDDRYGITLFVDNIGDSRGVTSGSADPLEQFIVRPRTFGVTVNYRI
ncbi:MAG: TonB-dependent receptor [Pseudomonadota bacterium]